MKTYRLIKPDDYKGLYKVSLVDDPAIQSNLMHFSEEKEFIFSDDEQRIIYAPALIPNKLIFRKNINGEPANVYFDSETIRQIHIDGCRNGYDNKVNLNHQEQDTDGIFCFEQWIIGDDNRAEKMGFELPTGTLMKGYKIDNDQVWQDIKLGKLKGLSIEGQLFPEEQKQQFNKHDMNKKSLWAMAVEKFKETFNFAEMTDYGNGYFGSSLEVGAIVSDKDGNPMPNAEFEYDGNKYKTDEQGAISEVEPVEKDGGEDLNAKILALETENAELKAKLSEYEATKMANEEAEVKLKADFEALKLSNEAVVSEVTTLKADNDKKLAEIIELKKVQAQSPVSKLYSEMTNKEKSLFNRGKL